jgi:anti-anti-sigma factor
MYSQLMESHMSTAIISRPGSPDSATGRIGCRTAHFATRWLPPSVAVITAHGELDASNCHEFSDYAVRHVDHCQQLVLDLGGVDFFGTAGFSALHTVDVRCAHAKVDWALVPSPAVSRLLRICDPDSALPIDRTVEAALSALQGEPRRLLQLVSKSR